MNYLKIGAVVIGGGYVLFRVGREVTNEVLVPKAVALTEVICEVTGAAICKIAEVGVNVLDSTLKLPRKGLDLVGRLCNKGYNNENKRNFKST